MPAAILVDTGPVVALLDRSDAAHDACKAQLDSLERFDLVTTEAVVTEASYILGTVELQASLQRLLAEGWLRVEALLIDERRKMAELIEKYSDLPMDYADATLLVLAERLATNRVFTLDRRDFSIYRVGRRHFDIVPRAT